MLFPALGGQALGKSEIAAVCQFFKFPLVAGSEWGRKGRGVKGQMISIIERCYQWVVVVGGRLRVVAV